VVYQGTVIATGSPAELVAEVSGSGDVTFTSDADVSFLHSVTGVRDVTQEGLRVTVTGDGPLLAHVAASLVGHGIAPIDLEVHRASLEDAYLKLTEGNR
jgi:ABC-2 type transport system ATP-binding protein